MDGFNEFEGPWNRRNFARSSPKQVTFESAVLFQLCVREGSEEMNQNLLALPAIQDEVQFSVTDLLAEGAQEFSPRKAVGRMAVHDDTIHIKHYTLQW
jgi:hypothetical protein